VARRRECGSSVVECLMPLAWLVPRHHLVFSLTDLVHSSLRVVKRALASAGLPAGMCPRIQGCKQAMVLCQVPGRRRGCTPAGAAAPAAVGASTGRRSLRCADTRAWPPASMPAQPHSPVGVHDVRTSSFTVAVPTISYFFRSLARDWSCLMLAAGARARPIVHSQRLIARAGQMATATASPVAEQV
jgi:hypothetical protein